MQLNEITWQTMEPYVGGTFRIDFAGGQHVDLKLTDVKKVLDAHLDPRLTRDSFSLYFVGPADFASALGLTGEGDMEKIEALFDQRYAADEGLRKAVEQGRTSKAAFRNYYGLRASVAFSYGSHDEWNILRLINDKRRGAQLGVANQIASFYDGRPTPPSAAEQPVSNGYMGRCN